MARIISASRSPLILSCYAQPSRLLLGHVLCCVWLTVNGTLSEREVLIVILIQMVLEVIFSRIVRSITRAPRHRLVISLIDTLSSMSIQPSRLKYAFRSGSLRVGLELRANEDEPWGLLRIQSFHLHL